jgi:hypothetical protein
MKKKIIVLLCAALALTVTVALSKNSETISDLFSFRTNAQTPEQNPAENSDVTDQKGVTDSTTPDFILFDLLFHLTKTMDQAAARLEAEGKSGRIWSEYYERHAGLSRQQANKLRQAADNFYREVEPVHRRAAQIVAQRRNSHANGQPPPLPSPELNALQKQRETIALRHRDRLRNLVGDEAFERLRQLMIQKPDSTTPPPPLKPSRLQMLPGGINKEDKNNE